MGLSYPGAGAPSGYRRTAHGPGLPPPFQGGRQGRSRTPAPAHHRAQYSHVREDARPAQRCARILARFAKLTSSMDREEEMYDLA
eukprot:5660778-Pyramimonas_sp.AAC.1